MKSPPWKVPNCTSSCPAHLPLHSLGLGLWVPLATRMRKVEQEPEDRLEGVQWTGLRSVSEREPLKPPSLKLWLLAPSRQGDALTAGSVTPSRIWECRWWRCSARVDRERKVHPLSSQDTSGRPGVAVGAQDEARGSCLLGAGKAQARRAQSVSSLGTRGRPLSLEQMSDQEPLGEGGCPCSPVR